MNPDPSDKLAIGTYQPCDESDVIDLWLECGLVMPWNNPQTDIARKIEDSANLFFTAKIGTQLIASCMAGYDGHRGWIYYLAVRKSHRRRGYAAELVRHAEARLLNLGCPKLELMVRNGNDSVLSFYQSIGYNPDPVMVLSKRLSDDEDHAFLDHQL